MTTETKRDPLTVPQKLALMLMVRDEYPGAELTDTEFAKEAALRIGRPVHPSTITSYREGFGIAAYKAPTQAELRAEVRRLQGKLPLTPVSIDAAADAAG